MEFRKKSDVKRTARDVSRVQLELEATAVVFGAFEDFRVWPSVGKTVISKGDHEIEEEIVLAQVIHTGGQAAFDTWYDPWRGRPVSWFCTRNRGPHRVIRLGLALRKVENPVSRRRGIPIECHATDCMRAAPERSQEIKRSGEGFLMTGEELAGFVDLQAMR